MSDLVFGELYGTKLTTTASYSGTGYIKSQGNTTAATYNNSSADHAFYTFKQYEAAAVCRRWCCCTWRRWCCPGS